MDEEERAQHESIMEMEEADSATDEDFGKGCRAKKYRKLDKEAGSSKEAPESRVSPIIFCLNLCMICYLWYIFYIRFSIHVAWLRSSAKMF